MRDCHREVSSWMKALGMSVALDAAGNLRGFYSGSGPEAPRIMLGSHLDTVPNAGAYDGVLGVVLAVALVESLNGRRLPFGIEVAGFSEEEGVRFGVPFIGSRALVGRLDSELLSRKDESGVSVRKAIENFGLNPDEIPEASLGDAVLGYVEFHIEQGPVLENRGCPLGVVEAIVGQDRLEFIFSGRANHAGTTPMHLRRDALAAAAEWILAVENVARRIAGLVATVGFIEARPGATNVIAGEARATLDLRHASEDVRAQALDNLIRRAEAIAATRGCFLMGRTPFHQRAVGIEQFLPDQIEQATRSTRCEPARIVTRAGPAAPGPPAKT